MKNIRELFIILLLAALPVSVELSCAEEIDSGIPGNVPQYINGDVAYEVNWLELGVHQLTEVECVDLRPVGLCTKGYDIAILWGYRLPVQFVENVPNAGESRYENPINNLTLYSDYENWYNDAAQYVGNGVSPISIDPNQRRRSGLRVQDGQNLSFSEAHLWSTDNNYVPLILQSFLPSYCLEWNEYEPFKTDVYPNQALWRIPEYTSGALPGAYEISPMQCAAANVTNGKMDPNLVPTGSISGSDYIVATKTCESSWGGKIWPLDGHSYASDPAVARALNTRKAIELASYAKTIGYEGSEAHSFNESKDRLQAHYPTKSQCFRMGENPQNWANGLNDPGKENHHVYIHWKYRTCCY